RRLDSGQPTAIVYRTVKGWRYGVSGRASHGAGHKLCSAGFYEAVGELEASGSARLPSCEPGKLRCEHAEDGKSVMEECFWAALGILRSRLEGSPALTGEMARRLLDA